MLQAIFENKTIAVLGIGIAIILIAVVSEWNAVLNHVRVQTMSLCDVEKKHPRLPRATEIVFAALLTISLFILFAQFIRTVYAMSFTLSSSTVEQKDTV